MNSIIAAMTQPWWPHLFSWPRFLDPISYWWLSVKGYALTSSWFQVTFITGAVIILRHRNCHVTGCPWPGHRVEGTSYLACWEHHPHIDKKTKITAADIAQAAVHGHNDTQAKS